MAACHMYWSITPILPVIFLTFVTMTRQTPQWLSLPFWKIHWRIFLLIFKKWQKRYVYGYDLVSSLVVHVNSVHVLHVHATTEKYFIEKLPLHGLSMRLCTGILAGVTYYQCAPQATNGAQNAFAPTSLYRWCGNPRTNPMRRLTMFRCVIIFTMVGILCSPRIGMF